MSLADSVKVKLKELRKSKGLSQERAAESLPFSRSKVAAQESLSDDAIPDVNDLEIYANLYGVDPVYFLDHGLESEDGEGSSELRQLYARLTPQNRRVMLDLARAISVPDANVLAEFVRTASSSTSGSN